MNLEEKIGQLLVFGFDGYEPSTEIEDIIGNYYIGGVILFGRNIKNPIQTATLCNSLQKMSKTPLFISIDQEGGRVSRLPMPFTQFPGNAAIGKSDSVKLAYSFGEITAKELNAVGINMDFAPVLDVNTNPNNPVINDRAFSDNPLTVSKLGLAVIAGLQDNGIIACCKHFPGHGDTSLDSHYQLPVVAHDLERLREIELLPFNQAVQNDVAAVMTAHVIYRGIDEKYPATISEKIIHNLLRKEMGFKGLVITDDLEMKAIADNYNIEDAAILAVSAGSDILLVCKDHKKQKAVRDALIKAVKDKVISEARIDGSIERIAAIKKRFLKDSLVDLKNIKDAVGNKRHIDIAKKISSYASTPL